MESVRFDFIAQGGAEGKLNLLSKSYNLSKATCDIVVELPSDRKDLISVDIKTYCVGDSIEPIIVDFECGGTVTKKCSLVAKNRKSGIVFSGFFDDGDSSAEMTPKLLFVDMVKNIFDKDGIDSNTLTAIRNQEPWLKITVYGAIVHENLNTLIAASRIETDGGGRGHNYNSRLETDGGHNYNSRIETDGGGRGHKTCEGCDNEETIYVKDDISGELEDIRKKTVYFETGKKSTLKYSHVDCTRLERIGTFNVRFEDETEYERKVTIL